MQLLSALLALLAVGGTLVLLVARLVAAKSALVASFVEGMKPLALPLSFAVSGFAMFGSLWFSEAANYNPCRLCWYQRTAMYPLAVITLVALIRRAVVRNADTQREITPYALTLAAVGLVISTYHYIVEWYPTLESNVCAIDVPCTTIWFREFGFVTLPFMAGCGFLSILILLSTTHTRPGRAPQESE